MIFTDFVVFHLNFRKKTFCKDSLKTNHGTFSILIFSNDQSAFVIMFYKSIILNSH